ncbi:flagellar hook protein FlgE [Castellaniella sp.]|uniref:flagellar hook protein FlgE n=1 Tax=Castellaniella sp. TaxID=1955812 RepID=UPI002AFE2B1E|nr:flagellar hook protein FlgE [Castellaniella sp.]
MGFGQGLSGLNAASQNLDVIGNNIANSGTVGFKSGSATFADVYANSRVGLGVQVASINQRFTTGIVSSTGNQFDMAIDGAKGLFVVQQPSGAQLYTRNGQFFADKSNNIVNAQGQQLMGYKLVMDGTGKPVVPAKPDKGSPLVGLTVPTGKIDPKATQEITTQKFNLDKDAAAITATFDPDDSSTYSNAVPITVYDSLGGNHTVTQYVVKTGSNAWSTYYTYMDSGDPTATPPVDPARHQLTGMTLAFDGSGRLTTTPPTDTQTIPGTDLDGANTLAFTVNFEGTTQFSGGYSNNFIQDGYGSGQYASMSIGADGSVVANYTNGVTQVMAFVVLADFANLQGLQPMGGNAWAETANSGQAIFDIPGQDGRATIKSQAVEESNVDMSQELVNMIIAQRTYQANAQTIKTQDQILQTLITMR